MEFIKFKKIPRLSRDIVITEKLDGTNGQIYIKNSYDFYSWFEHNTEAYEDEAKKFFEKYCLYVDSKPEREFDLYIFAGSRKRWLDCSSNGDNNGFAKWVKDNAIELLKFGEGRYFGEWYGNGIQRKYGLDEKRFALFNVKKWSDDEIRPKCCEVVPILYEGIFDTKKIEEVLENLRINGSYAVPGYLNPEGIVIYHKASGQLFKKTILNDKKPKTL